MQATNFGGTFDQLFLWIFFMKFWQKMPLYLFYAMVEKSQKWKGGPALTNWLMFSLSNGIFLSQNTMLEQIEVWKPNFPC